MQESLIGLPHLAHEKTPISATLNNGSIWVVGMMLPSVGREHAALSVTDKSQRQGGDGGKVMPAVPGKLVNIAHEI
jgi:hypothetical protein